MLFSFGVLLFGWVCMCWSWIIQFVWLFQQIFCLPLCFFLLLLFIESMIGVRAQRTTFNWCSFHVFPEYTRFVVCVFFNFICYLVGLKIGGARMALHHSISIHKFVLELTHQTDANYWVLASESHMHDSKWMKLTLKFNWHNQFQSNSKGKFSSWLKFRVDSVSIRKFSPEIFSFSLANYVVVVR